MVSISPAKVPDFLDELVFEKSPRETIKRTNENKFRFVALGAQHARQIAQLHIEGINKGFISSLGMCHMSFRINIQAKRQYFFFHSPSARQLDKLSAIKQKNTNHIKTG